MLYVFIGEKIEGFYNNDRNIKLVLEEYSMFRGVEVEG